MLEMIEVIYQSLGSFLGITFYHILVVYTDSGGNQWAARGGQGPNGNLRTEVF